MYGRTDHQGFQRRGLPLESVITRLIIANTAVFILQQLPLGVQLMRYLALTPRLALTRGYVWQMVTYMFLHDSLIRHLGLNMFVIWMFGRPLEQMWGNTRFLKFYLACGLGGAIFSFIFSYNTSVIGASAASYGILLAFAIMFPNQRLLLWFVIPVKARTVVIALVVISIILGISGTGNIAHFAHLGGMAAALFMMRGEYQFRRFRNFVRDALSKIPIKISLDRDNQGPQSGRNGPSAEKIDSILDKISEKGYENLSETERRILEKYSEEERTQNDDSGTLH
jgi:membrane associated rhomboid family serine protease